MTSRALQEALDAVARLRGDPTLDAEAWRLLRAAVAAEPNLPPSGSLEPEDE